MTNSLYLDYIKDPQNSTVKTKKQQQHKYPIGKWVKDMYRHFIKKRKIWQTNTVKYSQHHLVLGKCNFEIMKRYQYIHFRISKI